MSHQESQLPEDLYDHVLSADELGELPTGEQIAYLNTRFEDDVPTVEQLGYMAKLSAEVNDDAKQMAKAYGVEPEVAESFIEKADPSSWMDEPGTDAHDAATVFTSLPASDKYASLPKIQREAVEEYAHEHAMDNEQAAYEMEGYFLKRRTLNDLLQKMESDIDVSENAANPDDDWVVFKASPEDEKEVEGILSQAKDESPKKEKAGTEPEEDDAQTDTAESPAAEKNQTPETRAEGRDSFTPKTKGSRRERKQRAAETPTADTNQSTEETTPARSQGEIEDSIVTLTEEMQVVADKLYNGEAEPTYEEYLTAKTKVVELLIELKRIDPDRAKEFEDYARPLFDYVDDTMRNKGDEESSSEEEPEQAANHEKGFRARVKRSMAVARKALRHPVVVTKNVYAKAGDATSATLRKTGEYFGDQEKGSRRKKVLGGVIGVVAVGTAAYIGYKVGEAHGIHEAMQLQPQGPKTPAPELQPPAAPQAPIHEAATLSYKGDTVWHEVASHHPNLHGKALQDEVQRTLDQNHMSWEDAKHMHVGQQFDLTDQQPTSGAGASQTAPVPETAAQAPTLPVAPAPEVSSSTHNLSIGEDVLAAFGLASPLYAYALGKEIQKHSNATDGRIRVASGKKYPGAHQVGLNDFLPAKVAAEQAYERAQQQTENDKKDKKAKKEAKARAKQVRSGNFL